MSIQIYNYTDPGYKPQIRSDGWRVAILNCSPYFTREGMKYMERHILTDEVFVLLCGTATLLDGLERSEVVMEPGKIYNVPKGCWHNIITSVDAKVLIVERDDTARENTEYNYF